MPSLSQQSCKLLCDWLIYQAKFQILYMHWLKQVHSWLIIFIQCLTEIGLHASKDSQFCVNRERDGVSVDDIPHVLREVVVSDQCPAKPGPSQPIVLRTARKWDVNGCKETLL